MAVVQGNIGKHVSWASELGLFLVSLSGGPSGYVSTATSVNGIAWALSNTAFQPEAQVTGSAWNGTQFFVTGTSATDTIMSSTDGLSFSGLGKSLLTINGLGVCYGSDYNRWIIVGTGGNGPIYSISTTNSSDTGTIFPLGLNLGNRCAARYSVAETPPVLSPGPNVTVEFIAVGSGSSSIAYKTNQSQFFTPVGLASITNSGNDVAYSQPLDRWIIVGSGSNRGVISSNGLFWTPISTLNSLFSITFAISWSDAQMLWIAGGIGTFRIATSSDGITWTGRTSPFTTQVNGIAYAPERNIWVAVGSGSCAVAFSADGITWTQSVGVVSNVIGRHVSWSSDLGLFLVSLSGGTLSTITSVNGIAWSMNDNITNSVLLGSVWNGTQFIVAGSISAANTVYTSTDGLTFTGQGNSILTNSANGVCYGKDYNAVVYVGSGVYPVVTTSTFSIPFTTQGNRCFARYSTPLLPMVSAGPNVLVEFVSVGQGDSSIAYKIPGSRFFTPLGLASITANGNDVAFSPVTNTWIAVGSGTNRAVTSSNGFVWSPLTSFSATFTTAGFAIAYSQEQALWVAGGSGTNTIATSTDGINWVAQASSPFTTQVNGVAYSPQRNIWVAVGSGNAAVAFSTANGTNWVQAVAVVSSVVGRHVSWSPDLGLFLVSLSGGSLSTITSVNGIAWAMNNAAFGGTTTTGSAWNGTQFYLTGSNATDSILSSTDGFTFTGQGKTLLSTSGLGVCFSSLLNTWVFVGSGTSPVAIVSNTTTLFSAPFTVQGNRCFARSVPSLPPTLSPGPNVTVQFVVAGQGQNSIAYKIAASPLYTPIGLTLTSTGCNDVAYAFTPNTWIAVCSGTTRGFSSTNGFVWSPVPNLASVFTTAGLAIAYSEQQALWVAGGSGTGSKIAYSADGISWTGVASPFSTAVNGIAYSPERNRWVAVGSGGAVAAYSDNALTWTQVLGQLNSNVGRHVSWASELGLFLCSISGGPAASASVARSQNGITWIVDNSAFQTASVTTGSAWNGTLYYFTGTSATDTLMSSTDGINLIGLGKSSQSTAGLGVCYGADYNQWVILGSGVTNSVNGDGIFSSPFSVQANRCAAKRSFIPSFVSGDVPIDIQFVTVGVGGGNSIAYSIDNGTSFTPLGVQQLSTSGNAVAFSPRQGRWVVGGAGTDRGATSTNGIFWTALPSLTAAISTSVLTVKWSDPALLWMAGGSGTNRIATSTDGITWTARTTVFTTQVNSVAFSPERNMWVAVGSGTWAIAYSTDSGVTWVGAVVFIGTQAGRDVIWVSSLGKFFVAMSGGGSGSFTILSSANGIAWVAEISNALQPQAIANGIVWNGTQFTVAGSSASNTVMTSTDGVNYTGGFGLSQFPTIVNGLCFTDRWIYVGTGPNMITTQQVGTGTYSSRLNPFGTAGNACAGRYVEPNITFVVSPGPTLFADFVVVGTNGLSYSINGGQTFVTGNPSQGSEVAYSRTQQLWVVCATTMLQSPNGIQWTTLSSSSYCVNLIRNDEFNIWAHTFSFSGILTYRTSSNTVSWAETSLTGGGGGTLALDFSPQRGNFSMLVFVNQLRRMDIGTVTSASAFSFTSMRWLPEFGIFFATGSGGGITYATSPDGIAWTYETNIFPGGQTFTSGFNGTMLFVSGNTASSPLVYSLDGINFVNAGLSIVPAAPNCICYGAEYNRWVFGVGSTIVSMDSSSSLSSIITSRNIFSSNAGTRCAARYTVSNVPNSPPVPAYNVDFVTVGSGTSNIAYSFTQGRTYVRSTLGSGGNQDVAYSANTNTWINVGSSCGISTNGVLWTAIPSLNTLLGTVLGIGRSETTSTWIAGGTGTNKIATSTNGLTWTARVTPFTTQVNHIAYSKQLGIWVAAGSGTFAIASSSDNGVTWIGRVPFTDTIAGRHVTWATELGLFLVSMSGSVVGSTTSTATSSDGINWALASRAFQPQASTLGSAWNGTFMYLGGTSSTDSLMSSTNALNFTSLGKGIFNTAVNGVCWGAEFKRWMFQGSTTTSGFSISSLDGSTITHNDQGTGFRCAARYTNTSTTT
ncbi:MAG: hypothetical protein K2Q45_03095 [Nitrosomonas sp.]|nr:hypothetical protein [Nitrosomonas sp.]